MAQEPTSPVIPFTLPALIGALSGGLATIPMTIFMFAVNKALPRTQQDALPPEKITRDVVERADVHMNKIELLSSTLTAHLGYGSSMGSLYSTFTRRIPFPPLLKGAAFGILVWFSSYIGWLPAGRFSAAAPNESAPRNLLIIGAHIIWGATTGILVDQIEQALESNA